MGLARVMVTGGRNYRDHARIWETLPAIVARYVQPGEDVELIHGDNGNEEHTEGADRICASVAADLGWKPIPFPADWFQYGKAAGPKRNEEMARSLPKPRVCVAYPTSESRGTWDAVRAAGRAGIPVEIVRGPGGGTGAE